MSFAGMLEIADREFQAIQDADRELNARAESLVSAGQLETVEITPTSLKAHLDKNIGPDGRMSDFSYDWHVRLLHALGFVSLDQVHQCVSKYNDDYLSRLVGGTRPGQLSRFENMILAGLGEKFLDRHLWRFEDWFAVRHRHALQKFNEANVEVGWYDPKLFGAVS